MGDPVSVSTIKMKQGDGSYSIALESGLTTGVAAGSTTAGFLWAMRWAPPAPGTVPKAIAQTCLITRLRARLVNVTAFTTGQEVGMDLIVARAFTAAVTGGTASVFTTNNAKRRTSFPTSIMDSMPIATTGALTAGTHVLDAQPIRVDSVETVSTVQQALKPEIYLTSEDLDRYPIILMPNEGLIIRNTVAQGAAGTARLIVEVDWIETARY